MTVTPQNVGELPKLDKGGNLLAEEVEKRISGMEASKLIRIGNRDIRYAVLTQQGFYPDNMLKPNQDAYSIKHDVGGEEGVSHFAVYDGHGDEGHQCAGFARKTVPKNVDLGSRRMRVKAAKDESEINGTKFVFNPKIWPALTQKQCESICSGAYIDTNKSMHADKKIPDTFSGTTCVGAMLYGNKITISNTGDSRAVLGTTRTQMEEENPAEDDDDVGDIIVTTLSHDQTPYRRDELDRVRLAGARVLTIEQVNNNLPEPESWTEKEINYDGDIPRLFKKTDVFPGTAFTRSLGDSIAEEIGVIADPELVTREVSPEDRVLVLGSDGIFEFLTNEQVLNICMNHKDPLHACKDLLAKSYEEWLEYESRVDDMTVIVIFFE